MNNQAWMATLDPSEWYYVYDWLMHDYGSRFNNSRSAIIDWLQSDERKEIEDNIARTKHEYPIMFQY